MDFLALVNKWYTCVFVFVGAPYLREAPLSFQMRDYNSDPITHPFRTACPANVLVLHAVVTQKLMPTNVGHKLPYMIGQNCVGLLFQLNRWDDYSLLLGACQVLHFLPEVKP